ncbi:hypothetical protein EV426DRAFT_705895 [Tirmania nivea]|nr:hypothetical protein EV426DRAFT_705895 [Tirmania nivea]
MSRLPVMKTGNAEEDNRNLTRYAEGLIRQSYLSMRAVLHLYTLETANLRSQRPIWYLKAQVDQMRVWVWLGLNLLLPASAVIMLVTERATEISGRRRNPLINTALAPLLTDVRDILVEDANGISNMSYLTHDDTESIRILRLSPVDIPGAVGGCRRERRVRGFGIGRVIGWERRAVVNYTRCRSGKGNFATWRQILGEGDGDVSCKSCRRYDETGHHVALVCGEELIRRRAKVDGRTVTVDLAETFFARLRSC